MTGKDALEAAHKIWVKTDVSPDGTYIVTVDFTDDRSMELDNDRGASYAITLIKAAQWAEFDAAVIQQYLKMDAGMERAALVVADLRKQRQPIDNDATAPLRFEPGVSSRTHEPFVDMHLDGEHYSQLTTAQANQHAAHVLQVLATRPLDQAYYNWLRKIDLPAPKCRVAVEELRLYRNLFDG